VFPQRIRRAFQYLGRKAGLDDHLAGVRLFSDGRTILDLGDDGQLLDALGNGQK
jgi:hypothetical protein